MDPPDFGGVARVTGFVTFSAKIKIVNDYNRL